MQQKIQLPFDEIILILANVVPLIGIIFFGWDILSILLAFWSESAVIGFYTILKMILAQESTDGWGTVFTIIKKLFMIPFFMLHFGGFMLGHIFFIFFLGPTLVQTWNRDLGSIFTTYLPVLGIMLIALLISHGYSFVRNYLQNKEYKKASVDKLFWSPYARIIIMHLVIILGSMLIAIFKLPVVIIGLLVILKIWADLWAHRKAHSKSAKL